ncbi:MAG TPA: HEPN domain-containing protein [Candidatus Acidoferrales bacterium]
MAAATPIDRLYSDALAVAVDLENRGEVSLSVSASDNFRKSLLLAAASYFEHLMCNSVLEYVRERTQDSDLLTNFVNNKAISRQYHNWFTWDAANANQFFGLFGKDFREAMVQSVAASEPLQSGVKAFLEIGNERNKLVHQDYATFPLEKNLGEIYELYQKAQVFVDHIPTALRECDKKAEEGSA